MNRREFLQCAAVLVSGAGAGQLAFALSAEQQPHKSHLDFIFNKSSESNSGMRGLSFG